MVGGAPVEMVDGLDKLCCLGRVGGGWMTVWPVWRLNCFLKGAGGGGGGGGGGAGVGQLMAAGGGAGGNGETGDMGLGAV